MALIVDFLLLAASGAACFYCWILSTRIKAVTSTKDGVVSGIVALTQSAEEIKTAIAATRDATAQNAEKLEELLQEADAKIPEIRALFTQLSEISENAITETETATASLIETLTPHVKEAQKISFTLLDSLEAAYASDFVYMADAETGDQAGADSGSAVEAMAAEMPEEDEDTVEISVDLSDENAAASSEGEAA